MKKLPPKFKADWIARLRDPKTKQAHFSLKTKEGYCCLGVAIELANGPSCWILGDRDTVFRSPSGETSYPNYRDVPDDVYEALFAARGPQPYAAQLLAQMNDNGESFLEIADWIEENL